MKPPKKAKVIQLVQPLKAVPDPKKVVDKEIVDSLKAMLRRAEAGELRGISLIGFVKDGYLADMGGLVNRFELMFVLEQLKHNLVMGGS